MNLGLCMIVKDERQRLEGCLGDIIDLFDDVAVVDTGSTDGTPAFLRSRFGIAVLPWALRAENCFSKSAARNRSIAIVDAPWILSLDADEHITRSQIKHLRELGDDPKVAGYFCPWTTYLRGSTIIDYKLSLFRRGLKSSGLIHENIQAGLRAGGLAAHWLESLAIAHYPEPERMDNKRALYRDCLACALRLDPDWQRYRWFLGYSWFREGVTERALSYLGVVAETDSSRFPVERLNSCMVLAQIYAERGDADNVCRYIRGALGFYETVAHDFEVGVNFRLKPWLDQAMRDCEAGRLRSIQAYEFAY